jgi:RsiW-degrading membrane proteinase PrsW (M82 family)
MNWIVAGVVGGVGAFLADWVMWGKVFAKGMESYGTFPPSPEEGKKMMAAALPKSGALALAFGLLFACFYARLKGGLWVQGGGPLAGMEFATMLWLLTIALATIGSSVWYDKLRRMNKATLWSWLVRMNVAGFLIGWLAK